jgi:hypothetical protein
MPVDGRWVLTWRLITNPDRKGQNIFFCTAQLRLGGKAQGFELIVRRQIWAKEAYNKRLIITENSTALTVILYDHNYWFGLFLFPLTFLLESLSETNTFFSYYSLLREIRSLIFNILKLKDNYIYYISSVNTKIFLFYQHSAMMCLIWYSQ